MQSTTSPTPIEEFWWPHPNALNDMNVDWGEGTDSLTLEAPDDTQCGEWLDYWSATEKRKDVFESAFLTALLNYIKEKENGESTLTDGQQTDQVDTEENIAGAE
jgi:hypothetical protein